MFSAAGRASAGSSTPRRILTLNGGSSSIKFALFEYADMLTRLMSGAIDRIGLSDSTLKVRSPGGESRSQSVTASNFADAVRLVLDVLNNDQALENTAGIGHRIVHGGSNYSAPRIIDAAVLSELRRLCSLDPEHLPGEIQIIEAVAQNQPEIPQVACFDTAFHHDVPLVAQWVPIPRRYAAQGVRRYGFHGLSYQFLVHELARLAGPGASAGRVVMAHLGNGASMAALCGGKSIDTSMGFTPVSGLPMGTRSGDIDPGLVYYLANSEQMSVDGFQRMINHDSGLLGISETSSDMRDLLSRQAADHRAAEAVELFCYQARKWIGALVAALGGLETLVFSGGVGEHAPEVRMRICAGLEFLGVVLDPVKNSKNELCISSDGAKVAVWVIPTDEEQMIARHVVEVLDFSPR